MAIDRTGQVTTTGLMGGGPKLPKAPDLSGLSAKTEAPPRKDVPPTTKSPVPEDNLTNKVGTLSDEEKTALEAVLSPSIVNILKKVVPELTPLLDEAGSDEENVTLPISVVTQYAIKIYGGDEKQAVQQFITDLLGSQEMENNNVPLDTAQASTEEGMLAKQPDTSEIDAIDEGLV
jgi:hypothetical protein|tara:strand:- start:201 stop:728 length:528 start_codon:yes stop_codon:yes gene_type:complete